MFTRSDDPGHTGELAYPFPIHVRDVGRRAVEVAGFIPVTIEKLVDVVEPGEADRAADQIGVASGNIRGVIRAKARAVDREVAALRAIERVRNHLVAKIRIVLRMARRADGGVDMAVVPALAVNRIDAKELDLASIDFVGQRVGHPEVFVFMEASHRGGKEQYGTAELSEPEKFHFSAKRRAPPFPVLAIHAVY